MPQNISIIDSARPTTLAEAAQRKAHYKTVTQALDWQDAPTNGGYSINEMHVVFTKVQNNENWKFPINREVELTDDERDILQCAVPHFTGGKASIRSIGPGWYRVTAAGYYACVGA